MMLAAGVQLLGLGLVAELLTRVYHEATGRATYVVAGRAGFPDGPEGGTDPGGDAIAAAGSSCSPDPVAGARTATAPVVAPRRLVGMRDADAAGTIRSRGVGRCHQSWLTGSSRRRRPAMRPQVTA